MSNWISMKPIVVPVLIPWPALVAAQPADQPPGPTLQDAIVEPPGGTVRV